MRCAPDSERLRWLFYGASHHFFIAPLTGFRLRHCLPVMIVASPSHKSTPSASPSLASFLIGTRVPLYTGTAFMKGGYRAEGGSSGWTGSFVRPYTRILFFFLVWECSRNGRIYRCAVLVILLSGDVPYLAVHIHLLYRLRCHLTLRTELPYPL
ncbi:hypothetical protein BGW80DRAFT_892732 [Lactifluus volemus]|nr:hypothetical protein BGW80DRAFT_892732 [Lactifluus volemus]